MQDAGSNKQTNTYRNTRMILAFGQRVLDHLLHVQYPNYRKGSGKGNMEITFCGMLAVVSGDADGKLFLCCAAQSVLSQAL
jgi:hypothetical protein